MNNEVLKTQIRAAINQLPTTFFIYRKVLDELEEDTDEVEIISHGQGFYHMKAGYIREKIDIAGVTVTTVEMMMIISDEYTSELKSGDFISTADGTYKIIHPGKMYDVYFDLTLELM